MPVYRADSFFRYRVVQPKATTPEWMNLVVDRREEWRGEHQAFQGPGLYGVFFDDELFYIGLYAGKKDRPFGGSVFERWHKHIAYQIARSPHLSFTPNGMREILAFEGSIIATAFNKALAACGITPDTLETAVHPLIAKRNRNGSRAASCTPTKIRFAEQHWQTFGSDATRDTLDALMARFTFVYQQWPRDWIGRLAPNPGQRPGDWVASEWLAKPEDELIGGYFPVCNHPAGSSNAINKHYPVAPAILDARLAEMVAALDAGELTPAQALVQEEGEREEPDEAEERFRAATTIARWSDTLINDLQNSCPSAFDIYFTDTDDLRIGLKQPYARPGRRGRAVEVLITVKAGEQTGIQFEPSGASETCARLGFEPTRRAGHFQFDPDRHLASDLFAVAGAVFAEIMRG